MLNKAPSVHQVYNITHVAINDHRPRDGLYSVILKVNVLKNVNLDTCTCFSSNIGNAICHSQS